MLQVSKASSRALAGFVAAAGLVLSLGGGVASAQTPQQAIAFRKGSMQVQQWHLARVLVPMIKGQRPFDAAVYLRAMTTIEVLSGSIGDGYIPGSETGETRALPEVFKDPAGFRAAVERFQGEAKRAVAVARSGDEKAMRSEVVEMIKACEGCHERFRSK